MDFKPRAKLKKVPVAPQEIRRLETLRRNYEMHAAYWEQKTGPGAERHAASFRQEAKGITDELRHLRGELE